MLALHLYRNSRCRGCGGDLGETTDPLHDDSYRYMLPVQCHRCVAFNQAEKAYQEHEYPLSLMHRVELRRG